MPVAGKLWEGVLPGVLRELYVGRRTGVLAFSRGDERRNVHLRGGHIVNADTSVREDRMGEVMVRKGLLSAADLKRARGFSLRDNKRLGAVLLELGLIDEPGLERVLQLHVHTVLSAVFSWSDGSYEFTEAPAIEDAPGEVGLHASTGDLILEATRSVKDPDVVRYNLGDIDRVLALSSDPLLRFQRIALTPTDGFLLSRIDGTLSAREVMQLIPLPQEDVQRSLFGLLSTGIVEYSQDLPPKAAPPPAPRRQAAAPAPPVPEPAPAAGEPSAPEPAAATVLETRRMEIVEAYEGLATRTHYEALGIARDATEAQVKEAYFRMAKRFHPDAHHDPALHDLRDKLEAVFIRLGEAYEVLRNATTRASYERHLAASGEPGTAPPPAGVDSDLVTRQAEQAIRRAARSVAEEKYWEAIQLLETSITRVEGPVKHAGQVLLARAYAKNPHWLKQAEQLLQQVLQADPGNVDAYYHLAGIYRAGGLRSRMTTMLRKVLELKPDHEEAHAELEALEAESPPEPPDSGLLKKLLRRK